MTPATNLPYAQPHENQRIDDVTRRAFMTAAMVAAFTVACGEDDESPSPQADAGFPRNVDHVLGSTSIPTRPERIVTLGDQEDFENLLAMGVTPVLYGDTGRYANPPHPWVDPPALPSHKLTGITVNLEQVASAAPDLIIGRKGYVEKIQDQLNVIAPTVAVDLNTTSWRRSLEIVGQATGLEAEAERARLDTEAAARAASQGMPDLRGAIIRYASPLGGKLWVYGEDYSVGQVWKEIGVTFTGIGAGGQQSVSYEQINVLADADILILFDADSAELDALLMSPLMRWIGAAREGRMERVRPPIPRGIGAPSVLSMRWAFPQLAELVKRAAAGAGTRVE